MATRRLHMQIGMIYTIILVAVLGSTIFFSALHTSSLRSSIEDETYLSTILLSNELETVGDKFSEEFMSEMRDTTESIWDNMDFWIADRDGNALNHNGTPMSGVFAEVLYRQGITRDIFDEAVETGEYIGWLGSNQRMLLRQSCCIIRGLSDGRFVVLINSCQSEQAQQRGQFTLLMSVESILSVIIIILIANIINNHRRLLMRMATTDELTGLANRKSFGAWFDDFVKRDHPSDSSIFLLDIDYFKQINDNYGHAAGDHALRSLGGMIKDMVSQENGFAGRWGGDEFIGVMPVRDEAAFLMLEALCRRVAALKTKEGFRMTISVGVASANGETVLSKLSEKADLALYDSKEQGRNRVNLYRPDGKTGKSAVNPAQSVRSKTEQSVVQAEKIVISKAPEPEIKVEAVNGTTFRQRIKEYVQEKLITSCILGVRWMAPFVAGGGILIGLAFLFDAASVDLSSLTVAERANFGSITTLAANLKAIGGNTFNFMLPIFAGFMAYGIAGEDAFMAGFVGGYMTINSNAGFIGAMIAGFAAGVLTTEVRQFTYRMPKFVRKSAPIIVYPVINLLIMQLISWLFITPVSRALGNIFIGLLDAVAARSSVAAGALSSMMMATDMGGIINKVAYNYAVDGLKAGMTGIMASVMVGGMVPPIGIFLSMVMFRKKYTDNEWERGYGTLFMGLSFITEGALPYVFTDVTRVIPACMAGAAAAGAFSALFGCQLPAPHGGIFVLPVMTHPILYLLALTVGSMITAILLGVWKKEV